MTTTEPIPQQNEELIRLVEVARTQGERDAFSGKRQWIRYTLPMKLEVTTGPEDSSETWSVTMHNISGGGFGFWSKQLLEEGTAILVREWSRRATSPWLPARVAHSTIGIRGYLVGATFEAPIAPDNMDAVESGADAEVPRQQTRRRWLPPISLQAKWAISSGLAAALGTTATMASSQEVAPVAYSVLNIGMAAGLGLFFGGLISWLLVRSELSFLESLRVGIGQIARGEGTPIEPAEAPSSELAALGRAFLDLAKTWRQRQQDERLARHKLEELSQLKSNILSIVSHDLRTPLTSILLYAQMLSEELHTLEEEDQRRFLGIISDECTRLARLVDDLLEIQRLEAGRTRWDMQVRDLSETIRACARLFEAMARSKNMEFTVDCPETLPPVEADADKISQVLSNLLSNAMKYTPAGGKVRLSAQVSGRDIVLSVADDGPGIPREKWDQIFDRFSQLANPNVRDIAGCGLGLYIVKQMVERHGGAVWVDSEVGKGSEFFVSLPTKVPRGALDPDQPAAHAGRVLVCDADPELAAMISQTLRQEKYEVRQAHSGARLLEQLEHADVDVVVTDLLLPDAHAADLLEALTSIQPRVFGLVIHSYAGEGRELRARGIDVYLQRPASKEHLVQAVEVAAPQHRAGGGASCLILLIECERLHMARFRRLFNESGQKTMMTDNPAEAAMLIDSFPVDVIVTCDEALNADWAELKGLSLRDDGPGVVVISENVRQRERQLAESHGVNVIAGRRGHEEEIVAAILEAQKQRARECVA